MANIWPRIIPLLPIMGRYETREHNYLKDKKGSKIDEPKATVTKCCTQIFGQRKKETFIDISMCPFPGCPIPGRMGT